MVFGDFPPDTKSNLHAWLDLGDPRADRFWRVPASGQANPFRELVRYAASKSTVTRVMAATDELAYSKHHNGQMDRIRVSFWRGMIKHGKRRWKGPVKDESDFKAIVKRHDWWTQVHWWWAHLMLGTKLGEHLQRR
jgi:hypothetical protein